MSVTGLCTFIVPQHLLNRLKVAFLTHMLQNHSLEHGEYFENALEKEMATHSSTLAAGAGIQNTICLIQSLCSQLPHLLILPS